MQSARVQSNSRRFVETPVCHERPACDVTLSQFLKYLELLKEGEPVLREAVERDEELASLPKQRRSSQTKVSGHRRRSSGTSDVGHLVNGRPQSHTNTGVGSSEFQYSAAPFSLLVNSAHLRIDNLNFHEDESDALRVGSSRSCSPLTRGKTMARYGIRSSDSDKDQNHVPDGKTESSPVLHHLHSTVVLSPNLRRNSSTSTIFVYSASPCSRRESVVNDIQKNSGFRIPNQQDVALPSITFSSGESALFPRNKHFGANRRHSKVLQHGGTDSGRDSNRDKFYSDSMADKATRQTRFVHSIASRHTESQRKSQPTNAKGNVIFKELVLPCPHECPTCYMEGLPRPVRLYYSYFGGGGGRTAYLEGISDGNGKPGWPSSRKKEIKGLVYDRLSHSFHPPLPKKWLS